MMTRLPRLLLLYFLLVPLQVAAIDIGFSKSDPDEKRQKIDDATAEILADLYREVPGSQEVVEAGVGHAVFASLGLNVLALSTANGSGVAHYDSGEKVYMKMFSAGGGVGMGVKQYRLVFTFANQEAMDQFVEEGWTAGAQADAAAKYEDDGDAAALAIDVSPGVRLYQMTEAGVALQATIQGTKYWKDEDLN
ncbi:MAG: YSC84-related protein [Pseudomonadota bacterium]